MPLHAYPNDFSFGISPISITQFGKVFFHTMGFFVLCNERCLNTGIAEMIIEGEAARSTT